VLIENSLTPALELAEEFVLERELELVEPVEVVELLPISTSVDPGNWACAVADAKITRTEQMLIA
jgi:hypothetical protein